MKQVFGLVPRHEEAGSAERAYYAQLLSGLLIAPLAITSGVALILIRR